MKDFNIYPLTFGPKHHLFGFHDLLITNGQGDKYLSLEVDAINHPPLVGEIFGVGYVKSGVFFRIGDTVAMNYPQGARQQWMSDSNFFVVNNKVGNVWGTDLYDASINKKVDSYENATHALSSDGLYSYGLDYARLFRLGGYGYNGIRDKRHDDPLPSDTGITKMNMKTREVDLLVSVRQVAEFGTNSVSTISHHYLTHLLLNPSSTRIAFLHRYFMADGGLMTRLMTIGVDGNDMRCLAQGYLSHFSWKDDNTLYIYGRANNSLDTLRGLPILSNPLLKESLRFLKRIVKSIVNTNSSSNLIGKSFMLIEDVDHPLIKLMASGIITVDGHPMTNPINSNWCVNDTYPDQSGSRTLMLYNFKDNKRIDIGTFNIHDEPLDYNCLQEYCEGVDDNILKTVNLQDYYFTRSGLHCDLHPRWSRDGKQILFDSIHEGSRQIYIVEVDNVV